MKRLVTLMMCAVSFGAVAQITYPYNPDGNADTLIGVTDLQDLLSTYGGAFSPSEIQIDGVGLYEVLTQLLTTQAELMENYQALQQAVLNVDINAYWIDSCGAPYIYQGHAYSTIQIGNQCWFAENLRSENYANSDPIPSGLADWDWYQLTSGASAVYGENGVCLDSSPDIDACDSTQYLNEFGRLYNWRAVDDARGLCPNGWHVPTDGEWMTMEMALGMSEADANSTGWRGTDQGTQMKTDYGWDGGGNGTNSSGFSGLPGGDRATMGNFLNAGEYGLWWTSSVGPICSWYRALNASEDGVNRNCYGDNQCGYSVRCIKDTD